MWHSIIRRSKGSPGVELAKRQTIHVTDIITRVYHGVSAPMVYLLGRQVPNTMYRGEEIGWGGYVREGKIKGARKRARYPRVTGHTARFKRVERINEGSCIMKAIREHYPE